MDLLIEDSLEKLQPWALGRDSLKMCGFLYTHPFDFSLKRIMAF